MRYWSGTLNDAESNYDTTQRECPADVWSVLLLRPYVEGSSVIVRTDQKTLKLIPDLKQFSGRLARWRLCLVVFAFEIRHRPGRKNIAADASFRLLTDQEYESDFDYYITTCEENKAHTIKDNKDDIYTKPLTVQSFLSAQEKDLFCNRLAKEVDALDGHYFYDEFCILSRRARLEGATRNDVLMSLRARVLNHKHDSTISAHPEAG